MYLRGLHFQQWTAEGSIVSRLSLGVPVGSAWARAGNCFSVFPVLSTVVMEGLVGSGAGDHCLHSDWAFSMSGAPPPSPPRATESPLRLSAEDAHFHLRSSLACSPKEKLTSAGRILCLCGVFLLEVSPDLFIHPRWGIPEVCLKSSRSFRVWHQLPSTLPASSKGPLSLCTYPKSLPPLSSGPNTKMYICSTQYDCYKVTREWRSFLEGCLY